MNMKKGNILYRYNEYVLIILTGISFLLVLIGLALYLANPGVPVETVPLKQVLAGLVKLDSSSIIASGIVVLLFLPVILAVITTIIFACKREKLLVLASFAVVVFLCVSILPAIL